MAAALTRPQEAHRQDILTREGEISWSTTPRQGTTGNKGMLRELVIPGMNPLISYPVPSSQPRSYVHTNNTKQTQQIVCIFVHLYTYVGFKIKEKEATMNFKGSEKGI